jgi:hypothetical protein
LSSLFLKIFLSFWLAMVLVSATLIASVVTTQSQFRALRAEEFDRTVMPLMAARAADILDDHGMGALADFLSSLQTTLHWQAYLFDDEGKEILSQPTPPEAGAVAISALQSVETRIQTSHGTRFAATRTTPTWNPLLMCCARLFKYRLSGRLPSCSLPDLFAFGSRDTSRRRSGTCAQRRTDWLRAI